jgi:hypothetical protein
LAYFPGDVVHYSSGFCSRIINEIELSDILCTN